MTKNNTSNGLLWYSVGSLCLAVLVATGLRSWDKRAAPKTDNTFTQSYDNGQLVLVGSMVMGASRMEGAFFSEESDSFTHIAVRFTDSRAMHTQQEEIAALVTREITRAHEQGNTLEWVDVLYKDDGNHRISSSVKTSNKNPIPDGTRKLILNK